MIDSTMLHKTLEFWLLSYGTEIILDVNPIVKIISSVTHLHIAQKTGSATYMIGYCIATSLNTKKMTVFHHTVVIVNMVNIFEF